MKHLYLILCFCLASFEVFAENQATKKDINITGRSVLCTVNKTAKDKPAEMQIIVFPKTEIMIYHNNTVSPDKLIANGLEIELSQFISPGVSMGVIGHVYFDTGSGALLTHFSNSGQLETSFSSHMSDDFRISVNCDSVKEPFQRIKSLRHSGLNFSTLIVGQE